MSIKIQDKNNIPKYKEMLEELINQKIEVGIFSDAGSEILMIANVNEYGCDIKVTPKMRAYLHSQGLHLKRTTKDIKIPERSFIRSGFEDRKKEIYKTAKKLLIRVLSLDIRTNQFFDLVGQYSVDQIQEYLTDLKEPSNHPMTISNKGSSNPLINTGKLRDSITYRVVRG
ncbi:hypothetical protein [Desulfonispora thiosulfatigenes]|nr:hypothetical protein [Desulfonispora thiosulfatigenes]